MMLFLDRGTELRMAAESPRHLPGCAKKKMNSHRKVRRVEQGAPPLPKPLTYPGQLVCPSGRSRYRRNSELAEPLQVSDHAVGPGKFHRHVDPPQPLRGEGLAIGVLGAPDQGLDGVSSLLSDGCCRGAHLAVADDGNVHQSLPKNSRCSRRTTSGPSSCPTTKVLLIEEQPWEITSTLAGHTALKTRAPRPGVWRRPIPTTAMIARRSSTHTSPSSSRSRSSGLSRERSSMVIEMLISPLARTSTTVS